MNWTSITRFGLTCQPNWVSDKDRYDDKADNSPCPYGIGGSKKGDVP